MKVLKKYYKLIIVFVVILIIALLGLFIYKNLFEEGVSNRLEDVEKYKLTKDEKKLIKEKFNELGSVDSVEIYTNYKIIKLFLVLSEDIDFEDVKEVSNGVIEKISEENLSFYDVEIFVDSKDEESETYPKIGYKHKTNSEFTWNR